MDKSIHTIRVNDAKGNEVSLADYSGKVLLLVNTASQCGFTPQLDSLEKLYQEYKEMGFEVLAFPSNDFGSQEPLEGEKAAEFCEVNFNTTFKVFDKVKVKGDDAHDLFKFLTAEQAAPKWNFHKYLIAKDGSAVDHYFSTTKPTAGRLKRAIKKELTK